MRGLDEKIPQNSKLEEMKESTKWLKRSGSSGRTRTSNPPVNSGNPAPKPDEANTHSTQSNQRWHFFCSGLFCRPLFAVH